MGARWYEPQIARRLSADTIAPNYANPQNLNRYAYVQSSPLNYVDPSGHMMEDRWSARYPEPPQTPPIDGGLDEYARWCAETVAYLAYTEGLDHEAIPGYVQGATNAVRLIEARDVSWKQVLAFTGIGFLIGLGDAGPQWSRLADVVSVDTYPGGLWGNLETPRDAEFRPENPPLIMSTSEPPGPSWEWRPSGITPETHPEGAWYNPNTDEYLRPHLDPGPGHKGPHYDY